MSARALKPPRIKVGNNINRGSGLTALRNFKVYNGGTNLFFGPGVTGDFVAQVNGSKLLVVTGRRSAVVSGALPEIEQLLKERGITIDVVSGIKPNPEVEDVAKIVEKFDDHDGLLSIGGGSVIDSTKVARLVIACGGKTEEYLRGERRCKQLYNIPLYVVNLTHGTGTEIDRWAVVTDPSTKVKYGIDAGYPTTSLDNPIYLKTLPRDQTTFTAIDAFAHSFEGATAEITGPYAMLLASEAISKIVEYLPKTLTEPDNIEYRYWLLYASMLGGIVEDNSECHIGHAVEHVLSGYNPRLPHGAGLAIVYRELLPLMYMAEPEGASKALKGLDPTLRPTKEDAEKARKAYLDFLEKIGYDKTLSDYGFGKDDIREVIELAFKEEFYRDWISSSPVKLTPEKLEEILHKLI